MSTAKTPDLATTTRTRTFSWQDPAASAAEGLKLAGLDYMRAIQSGELPPPTASGDSDAPMFRLPQLDMSLREGFQGRVHQHEVDGG
ncbi:MAG TPA: hypothetical protein VN889_00160 [Solirubrobacteraceae bacterium]|nr:hypothetical protein [Solirubrobacteraceae bacterium]